ncbi:Tol-Pal system beta propeller repeat protein TolB [Burkholderiaceae bacterium DAT-1]|nr:Tol-Pal system beta propeller repeat protein TolB [Burkholderiaceae bacterium DAT-1]
MKLFDAFKVVLLGLLCASSLARADITIEITGPGAGTLPIAVAPLGNEELLKEPVSQIIRDDLQRSGRFKLINAADALPDGAPADWAQWKNKGADSLALGVVKADASGIPILRFRLYDTLGKKMLAGVEMRVRPGEARRAAHQLADLIYQTLTGDPGVFNSKIAYVSKRGSRYSLEVADADGFGAQTVMASNQPIMSITWAPDGRRMAYVSFERDKATVWVQDVFSGSRREVAKFKGNNSAPAFSADGKHLAVALSLDGHMQIYMIPADGGSPRKVTSSIDIDTEPNFSPDGKWMAFTSNRGGSPQVYLMPAGGGEATRLTFEGSYSVSPKFSPDSKTIAFMRRENGQFHISTIDVETRQSLTLTGGDLDESPTFAPNGRTILYNTKNGSRGVLSTVSSDGLVRQRLSSATDVVEAAWGPMNAPLPAIQLIGQ